MCVYAEFTPFNVSLRSVGAIELCSTRKHCDRIPEIEQWVLRRRHLSVSQSWWNIVQKLFDQFSNLRASGTANQLKLKEERIHKVGHTHGFQARIAPETVRSRTTSSSTESTGEHEVDKSVSFPFTIYWIKSRFRSVCMSKRSSTKEDSKRNDNIIIERQQNFINTRSIYEKI